MKKLINLVTIAFICFIALSTIVFATDIDMNLQSNNQLYTNGISNGQNNTNTIKNNIYDDTEEDIYEDEEDYSSQSTTVTSVPSVTEETFGLSHVLNILLIVVGIVLILLGIAILIRLK